jgi:hypothetical protein
MNISPRISQNELQAKQQMTDMLLTDREAFRAQAASALRQYSRRERKLLRSIETVDLSAYDVLIDWRDMLHPLRMQLESKRLDKQFHTAMVKQLVLRESEADAKIRQLIDDRLVEVDAEFIAQRYSPVAKQYASACKFLQLPEQELSELLAHLVAASLVQIVAHEHDTHVVDAHASLWQRMVARSRVRRERKQLRRKQAERLAYITKRQQELTQANGGLLFKIADKGWDLIVIISMLNQYEKRIKALSTDDAKSAVKRLAVYEKTTKEFRDTYIETVSAGHKESGLEFARAITKEVDDLLLRIFELSTIQKNRLLIDSKEYRELEAERQAIVAKS